MECSPYHHFTYMPIYRPTSNGVRMDMLIVTSNRFRRVDKLVRYDKKISIFPTAMGEGYVVEFSLLTKAM